MALVPAYLNLCFRRVRYTELYILPQGTHGRSQVGTRQFPGLPPKSKVQNFKGKKILDENKLFTTLKTIEGEGIREVGQLCKFKHEKKNAKGMK